MKEHETAGRGTPMKPYVPAEVAAIGKVKCPKGFCSTNYCPKSYCPGTYCSANYVSDVKAG
jgi:hypothetical protein